MRLNVTTLNLPMYWTDFSVQYSMLKTRRKIKLAKFYMILQNLRTLTYLHFRTKFSNLKNKYKFLTR